MAKFIEGPAGAGKTKRLIELVASATSVMPLAPHQAVLGLTFMHGSRRRMHARLDPIMQRRSSFYCATFDSFARTILLRWSPLLRMLHPEHTPKAYEFDETCSSAAELMERDEVSSWIAARFPLVIVDEAQDLDGHRLRLLKAISRRASLFAAADEFQDLRATIPNDAVSWLQTFSETESLSVVYRTKCPALLEASVAIREGRMPVSGRGFEVVSVPTAPLAAWHIGLAIRKSGRDTVAVLSPSHAPFTTSALNRLAEAPLGKSVKIGPYDVTWETNDNDEVNRFLKRLDIPEECAIHHAQAILRGTAYEQQMLSWLRKLFLYGGTQVVTKTLLREKLEELVHSRRSFTSREERKLAGMTIHQAKNREFGTVVLLWPQIGDKWTIIQQRRLLYNAVTRAKNHCVVIVHEPKVKRRLEGLFL